jgi:inosine/xanthosine triphosphatase
MRIIVGSNNSVKVDAVREVLALYERFRQYTVHFKEVPSGVAAQPLGLEETIRGARNRAANAFEDCTYSIGIESGIFKVRDVGHMDLTACAIYDQYKFYIGLGPAFIVPSAIMKKIRKGWA